ncbi:MAG: tRNA (adenosine(37)-N6)-threonylcarbamoyltransferase complex ATPase subunit type 1 TsaE [Candidatus Taylorbacteria bacterium]|nr:tRNA (adenosine(37)-N6)-threonylcarbamoyltransferase complex ATPase subunit type 1 TsaE [Candidatus Taylorbacteria bacterium]
MEFLSNSLDDTNTFATNFLEKLVSVQRAKPADHATVVGLYGNLGSGKTTFVQALAKALGVETHVSSPTFLIMKSYKLSTFNFQLLTHVDAYRLKGADELSNLRFDELLANPQNLILIEWADKVADLLPLDHIRLTFEFVDEKTRKLTLKEVLQ